MNTATKRILFTTVLCILTLGASSKDKKSTPAIMQKVFGDISELIPKTYNDKEFLKYSKETEKQLKSLSVNAQSVESHIANIGDLYGYAASRLKEDANEAYALYKRKKYNQVKFILRHITEDCIACHSKASSPRSAAGVKSFIAKLEKTGIAPLELAHYLTAARQFKRARNIYEAELKKSKSLQKTLDSDAMLNYLLINIRIFKDLIRPLALLKIIKPKKALSGQNKDIYNTWVKDLKAAQKHNYLNSKNKLVTAEKIIGNENDLVVASDKKHLINYIIASTLLNQLSTQSQDPKVLNKSYYLLGLIVEQVESSLFVSETDYYLEKSITLDPGSKVSKKALQRLKDYVEFGYSGSSGTHIPDAIQKRIKELEEIVKNAKKT